MRPSAEITLSADETAALIGAHFPELAPIHLKPFGEGWDNVAWRVNGECVFRFPRRQMGADCMQSELTVLPHLVDRLPLEIPHPVFIGEACDEFPWPFAGYRLLSGTPADELRLNMQSREPLAAPLGRFLRTLHAIPADEVRGWQTPLDTLGRLAMPGRTDQARKYLADAETAGLIRDASQWESILLEAEEETGTEDRSLCLVHGDLHSKHILIEAGQLSGVIDWGDVHLGDPAADVAFALSFFEGTARQSFFEAYGTVSEQTLRLARMRVVNHSAACVPGSGDDAAFQFESQQALERVLTR
jgi:aminoglycoside phosphotransferase (APT) family kinase protein